MRNSVRLHVSVVVLTRPNEPSLTLQALCHHVVNETVLIPNACLLKLLLVLTAEGRGEERRGGGEGRGSECGGVSCVGVRGEVGWNLYSLDRMSSYTHVRTHTHTTYYLSNP